ncbi:transcription initiation factor TFIID subunit 4-like [Peromyscus leucopus]|uniref:transcription initiation factor TFIID subunit 4-like n=1 Tax=Peromyscus leucopus TaxID=10041 RepID=UPI0010A0CB63|nr:transcription initiation factor TFIID subunit 4-like [Peromyscus leucopus]
MPTPTPRSRSRWRRRARAGAAPAGATAPGARAGRTGERPAAQGRRAGGGGGSGGDREQEATAEYAPDGPTLEGLRRGTAHRPAAAPAPDALGRGGQAGTGDWDRNAERPSPCARPLGFRPLPSREAPDGAAGTRRRLAAGMVLSGGQRAPAPGAVAASPTPHPTIARPPVRPAGPPRPPLLSIPPSSLPPNSPRLRPGAPRARARRLPFARSLGPGVIRRLCCHGRCRNRLRAPAAPAPPCAAPEPGPGRHVGPGTRWRCALTCRRCGRGGA